MVHLQYVHLFSKYIKVLRISVASSGELLSSAGCGAAQRVSESFFTLASLARLYICLPRGSFLARAHSSIFHLVAFIQTSVRTTWGLARVTTGVCACNDSPWCAWLTGSGGSPTGHCPTCKQWRHPTISHWHRGYSLTGALNPGIRRHTTKLIATPVTDPRQYFPLSSLGRQRERKKESTRYLTQWPNWPVCSHSCF